MSDADIEQMEADLQSAESLIHIYSSALFVALVGLIAFEAWALPIFYG